MCMKTLAVRTAMGRNKWQHNSGSETDRPPKSLQDKEAEGEMKFARMVYWAASI